MCAKKGLERIFAASFALAGLLTGWSAAADSISYSQPFTYMLSVSGQTYAATGTFILKADVEKGKADEE